jgi:vitamin B12 transporter
MKKWARLFLFSITVASATLNADITATAEAQALPTPTAELSPVAQALTGTAYQAETIVISASRSALNVKQTGKTLSVLSGDELRAKQSMTVADALREVPGLSVFRTGGLGTTTSVFVRGGLNKNLLVLIDGVPVNDPSNSDGAFDWANLSLLDVDRIEVVRGPASTRFGSAALAGAVNIITRKGGSGFKWNASAEGGSYGTHKETLALSGGDRALNFAVTGGFRSTSGFSIYPERLGGREADGSASQDYSVNLGSELAEGWGQRLSLSFNNALADLDGSGVDDLEYRVATETLGAAFTQDIDQTQEGLRQRISLGYTKTQRRYVNQPDANVASNTSGTFEGEKSSVQFEQDLDWTEWAAYSFGASHEVEGMTTEWLDYVNPLFSSKSDRQEARTSAFFVEQRLRYRDRLFVNAAARLTEHSNFGTRETYSADASLLFPERGTRFKASWGTGFKAPSLYQLNNPLYGNPLLKPEISEGWDAGVEQDYAKGRLQVGFTHFVTAYPSQIVFNFLTFKFANAPADTRYWGNEVYAVFKPFAGLRLKAAYTNQRNNGTSQQQVVRRPEHSGSATLDYRFLNDKAQVGVQGVFAGLRKDIGPSFSTIWVPAYEVVNLTASYLLFDSLTAFARIENLFDRDYEEVYGFASARRGYYAGVRLGAF